MGAALTGSRSFAIGADLGQQRDPTALAVVECVRPVHLSGLAEPPHFDVTHLARFPLGTAFPEVVGEVERLAARLWHVDPDVVVDATGLGRPVVDQLRSRGAQRVIGVTFTAGDSFTRKARGKRGAEDWTVSKRVLVGGLAGAVYGERLRVAEGLGLAADLLRELADLEVHVGASGAERYDVAAAADHHADLATAVALACWRLARPPRRRAGWRKLNLRPTV